ncbi:MAG TPA: ATP-binding protein, partial [Micromonosporaceae bacterium]
MNGDPDKGSTSRESEVAVPAPRGEPDSAVPDVKEGMRRGIRSWVTDPGRWLRPTGSVTLAASLTAGALAPCIAAALVGDAGGVWTAALNQLGQIGCGFLSDQLVIMVDRLRGRKTLSEAEIRKLLASELERDVTGAEASLLRAEMTRLLQSVGGIEAAVTAAIRSGNKKVSADLVSGLRRLAELFAEFRPLLDEMLPALSRMEQSVAEQRHAQQLNIAISERILVEVGLTRRELSEARWQSSDAIVGAAPSPVGAPVKRDLENNPYLGLEPFQSSDAGRFFGRVVLTERLRTRLAESARGAGTLLVIGPSGSGKSSLLRAGLVPLMRAGLPGVSGSGEWPYPLVCTAIADPLDAIVTWTASRVDRADSDPSALRQDIERDPDRLAVLLREAMPNRDHRLLIVVDQFEQMFASHQDPTARATLLRALRTAASPPANGDAGPPALVVLGVRADFYPHCISDEVLARFLPNGQFPVPPMTEAQLRDVICRPAHEVGVHVEPSLVERIMRDLGLRAGSIPDPSSPVDLSTRPPRGPHQGAVLPLLSHALRATWTAGTDPVMTVRDYESTGGLHAAV